MAVSRGALQWFRPAARIQVFAGLIGLGGALLGYDIGSISGILEMQEFKDTFKYDDWSKGFIVTALVIGATLGSLASSYLSDYIGRKRSIALACFLFDVGAIGQTFANTLGTLYGFRIISGIGIGISSSLVPLYNAEVAPKSMRGTLVTYNQIAMTGGIMIAFWINYALRNTHNGWRIAMALQAVPATIILVATTFLPSSPRWLVKMGRESDAIQSLFILRCEAGATELPVEVASELAEIQDFCEREKALKPEAWINFLADGQTRRKLMTACALQSFQQLTGINSIMYYAPSIFQSLGFDGNEGALMAQGINGVINFLFTLFAFYLMDRVGRKTLLIVGATIMAASLGLLAALGWQYSVGSGSSLVMTSTVAGYACIGCVYSFVAAFAVSWGPVVWLMCTELFGTAQRARGVSLSTATNWAWNIVIAQFVPVLQTKMQWNLYSIFGAWGLVMACFTYYVVPETGSKSLEAIQADMDSTTRAASAKEKEPLLVQY